MLEIFPTLGRRLGPGELQIGGRLPVTGRNLPGGVAYHVGYFLPWGDRVLADEQRSVERLP